MVKAKGHPIAPPSGTVAISRLTLYDKIGPGPHPCHWCERPVDWMPGASVGEDGSLLADHLDWDPTNDDPANLVPTCNPCNSHRRSSGASRRIEDEEHWVMWSGSRTRAVQRSCEYCGDDFLTPHHQVKIGRGRFCSRSCARRKPRN